MKKKKKKQTKNKSQTARDTSCFKVPDPWKKEFYCSTGPVDRDGSSMARQKVLCNTSPPPYSQKFPMEKARLCGLPKMFYYSPPLSCPAHLGVHCTHSLTHHPSHSCDSRQTGSDSLECGRLILGILKVMSCSPSRCFTDSPQQD